MFGRLGSWCFRRRRATVLLWVLAVALVGFVSSSVGGSFGDDAEGPDFESSRGMDTLEEEFGGQGAGIQGTIVFRADAGVDDPAVQRAMEGLFTAVEAMPEGIRLTSPYAPDGASQVSEDGRIAFASMEIPGDDFDEAGDVGRRIEDLMPEQDGLQIELGGDPFGEFEEPSSEVLGLAFAVVILVLAFGSVLAMGLPIGVALAGIVASSLTVTILSQLIDMPDFAPFLGIMIGLGVGIDYALLIVTRYRENLHRGLAPERAAASAVDTAGRAVAFAGLTVVVSFLGMVVMGISFIQGLAVSCAVVVLMTVLASLTLLPALLGFAGERIEVTRWRGVLATGFLALGLVGVGLQAGALLLAFPIAALVLLAGRFVPVLQRIVHRRPPKPIERTWAYRWSRLIQHHPWPAAIGGALVLLVLALPTLGLRLGFSDEGNYAEDTTTRQAYDLLADGFGPGFNGPFFLSARVDGAADPAVLADITDAVAADPEVSLVSPALPNGADPSAYVWHVAPASAPQDAATTDLVHRLRDDVLVDGEAALGSEIAVTGAVPFAVDFSDFLGARLPYFFGAVLAMSFLLLMVVFRSLLVPLKAVVMNMLSIGAAYGITVVLVQWGWLGDLTGLAPGPIESFAPMMLFAVVFGLSMDYEVFLLSRVREEWHRTGDSHLSVANGLATTARVITAAAAIMVFVFGSFMFESDRIFKLFGVGLSTAILLDATIVRMLLVPATMELLGDRNWRLPRWLDRRLPQIDVEGHGLPDDIDAEAEELARELEPQRA